MHDETYNIHSRSRKNKLRDRTTSDFQKDTRTINDFFKKDRTITDFGQNRLPYERSQDMIVDSPGRNNTSQRKGSQPAQGEELVSKSFRKTFRNLAKLLNTNKDKSLQRIDQSLYGPEGSFGAIRGRDLADV